jgi:AhpD family alkylhydroperoxidase
LKQLLARTLFGALGTGLERCLRNYVIIIIGFIGYTMTMRYLDGRRRETESPMVTAIYAQIRRDFGLVAEPFRAQAPVPEILAAAWSVLREAVLCGVVPRRVKETVAAVVSQTNRCRYCVDVHTSLLHAAGGWKAAWALRRRAPQAIDDSALRAAAEWAGASRTPGAAVLAAPPFDQAAAPEMIASAAAFHYINRLATIFLADTPFPIRARLFAAPSVLVTSRRFAPRLRQTLAPGASLAWLAPAELPADLSWARPRPEIAAGFASLAAATEAEAGGLLGEGAAAVRERIAAWCGEDPPLAGGWVEEATAGLPAEHRAAAHLALLVALAPYRVGAAEVAAFRAGRSSDRALVAVVAWASFAAARRISTWLDPARASGTRAVSAPATSTPPNDPAQ